MGETVKLVNQIIIASVMIANVEALVFAKRAGANLDNVRKVLATATGSNYVLEKWLPKTWLGGNLRGGIRARSLAQGPRGGTGCGACDGMRNAGSRDWPINFIRLDR